MNNLRRDIHSAFEVIEPPLGGMPERVVQTVLADKRRRRKEGIVFAFRAPFAIAAAVLLIAVIAAGLLTWNSLRNESPAGQAPTATVAQLESRPLMLKLLKPADACPSGPFDPNTSEYGSGPFHAVQGQALRTSWGAYFFLTAITEQRLRGPILVRVEEVRSAQRIVFVGQNAAGPVLGTDTLRGSTVQQHPELVFDTSHPQSRPVNGGTYWSFTLGVPIAVDNSAQSCYGWQVDGQLNGRPFVETFHTP